MALAEDENHRQLRIRLMGVTAGGGFQTDEIPN
jgi:hypothetical protein